MQEQGYSDVWYICGAKNIDYNDTSTDCRLLYGQIGVRGGLTRPHRLHTQDRLL